jgi:ABC-type transport system involved in resistance to organic solvents, ATPase component
MTPDVNPGMYHVTLDRISKAFGPKQVLNGVSMDFPPGQISVIIGPSGCGKSTILRLLLGLIRPDEGSVFVGEKDVTRNSAPEWERLRESVGMVFQSAALFDSMTVGENVAFVLREHTQMSEAERMRIVKEKLEVVGLAGTENLYPTELSGGMQKRVAIARAIVRNPSLVLYDEPTTGLDPVTSTIIEDLIVRVARESGATSVVVTHQLSTIFRTADRITMLHKGRVLESGTPEEMKASQDPLVSGFLRGEPLYDSAEAPRAQ